MNDIETAVEYFNKGCSCSQAVLAAYGPKLGLDRESALKIASTFGGGIARTGQTCGAVTGALMALGLKYNMDDPKAKDKSIALAREFLDKFKACNGSTTCRELVGYDVSTPEGFAYARENKLFGNCGKFVRNAAEIVEDML